MVESGCRVEVLASLCPADERPLRTPDSIGYCPTGACGVKISRSLLSSVKRDTSICPVSVRKRRALDLVRLPTPRDFRHRALEHSIKQYYALLAGNSILSYAPWGWSGMVRRLSRDTMSHPGMLETVWVDSFISPSRINISYSTSRSKKRRCCKVCEQYSPPSLLDI